MRLLRLIAEAFAAEIERQTLERERARVAADEVVRECAAELATHIYACAMNGLDHKELN